MKNLTRFHKLVFLNLLLTLIFSSSVYSQNHFTDNYPLKIGNVFTYRGYAVGNYNVTFRSKTVIEKDTIINNKKYYVLVTVYSAYHIPNTDTSLRRIDTLTGNLLVYIQNVCPPYVNEMLVDSLWSMKNDSARMCGTRIITCIDTGQINFLGMNVRFKLFHELYQAGAGWNYGWRKYAQGLGKIARVFEYHGPPMSVVDRDTLIGCVINGVVYGDTALLIGIGKISQTVPFKFNLYQNYPNPFNPATTIKFDVPKSANINLGIYDILGRELYVIANQYLTAGTYSFEWDAKDYPSGIYFYRLSSDDFTETKKMVLIK